MKQFTSSPWTSGFGSIGVLLSLYHMWETKTIDWEALQAILVSLGLIQAKDWNVTGGSREQ